MALVISVTSDFESTRAAVVAAMLYPRSEAHRTAYCLRKRWAAVPASERVDLSALEIVQLLDAPSRADLQQTANDGIRRGIVAGDLLALIYQQWRRQDIEPSMRSALAHYRSWSLGKKYGDEDALKYSDMQLRRYFVAAEPAAHLWAAFRILQSHRDRGKAYRTAFERDGLPYLLAVARELQDFACTFVPKRKKSAKPIIKLEVMLSVPDHIKPIAPVFRPL